MSNILQYKNFYGSIEFSLEDSVLFGKLLYVNDLVTYEGETLQELHQAFCESVDDYIAFCEKMGKEPEKPFKGTFNVRISPELHKAAALKAAGEHISLNQLVSAAVESYCSQQQPH